jgi:hypothetical protein
MDNMILKPDYLISLIQRYLENGGSRLCIGKLRRKLDRSLDDIDEVLDTLRIYSTMMVRFAIYKLSDNMHALLCSQKKTIDYAGDCVYSDVVEIPELNSKWLRRFVKLLKSSLPVTEDAHSYMHILRVKNDDFDIDKVKLIWQSATSLFKK